MVNVTRRRGESSQMLEVALLTVGDPGRLSGGYLFHRRLAERASRHNAELRFVSVPSLPLPWAMAAGRHALRTPAIRRADALVLDSLAAAAASPWLGSVGRPIVAMLHQLPGGMEGPPAARAVRATFDRWAYRHADRLLVASGWLAEQLVSAGVDRRRLLVLPPGKDAGGQLAGHQPAIDDVRRADLRAGRMAAVLCVANWLPRKGIVELLAAIALTPEPLLTLHLVGDTQLDRGYSRRVHDRLAESAVRDRVVVHGPLAAAAVAQLYRAADVFALPSFEEPYGTVWGEAMAAGLPVVGWRAANLPFLADHEREALMVEPGDVYRLSQAVERLCRDEPLRRRLGHAAAARAATRPTWDQTAAAFFAAIRDVLAGATNPRR